jgi:membrane-associated protein
MELSLAVPLLDILLHVDKYLNILLANYGTWVYLILFLVIFCETGLVVTPFLPGDSLLFMLGALAASGELNLLLIAVMLIVAAIAGNVVNYYIGRWIGPRVFSSSKVRFFNRDHLMRTHAFYEKNGGKTIFLARFIPILRTFAPFVAGIGGMTFTRFQFYNISSSMVWVLLFLGAGYSFGNIPIVENNFTLVVYVIIFISLLPALITFLKQRGQKTPVVSED